MWELNNKVLNNQCVKKKITREIGKYFNMNENEDIPQQNSWNAAKTVLRRKVIAVNTYIKKILKSTI